MRPFEVAGFGLRGFDLERVLVSVTSAKQGNPRVLPLKPNT
ncbi:MAG: hypothetical protein RMJ07_05895 [Nitrososphaerota archaeon]|nr:hypothetical protein [Candidatus Bathyarchaeota archaeon]MDW8049191.1 hypothetical protein [Nitrososphaerota archaeon]